MIGNLEKLNKKSFNDYSGPSQEFKRINIIFGYNGRGKSALAEGLVDAFIKEEKDGKESYRYFNRHYIKENVMLSDSEDSRIKGVVANFGSKDVDIEEEIKDLKAKIVDSDRIKMELDEIETQIKQEVDHIHDSKKGTLRILKKPASKSIGEIIDLYKTDMEKARKIEPNIEEIRTLKGDDKYERREGIISSIKIPEPQIFNTKEIERINEIFSATFDNVDIPSIEVVEWIERGIAIHDTGEKCKFCGGEIDLDIIKEDVDRYKANKKQKASNYLKEINQHLKTLIETIGELKNAVTVLKKHLVLKPSELEDELTESIKQLCEYEKKINIKQKDIDANYSFNEFEFNRIMEYIDKSYMQIKKNKDEVLQENLEKKDNIDILVKGGIGLAIEENTFIQSKLNDLKTKNNEYKLAVQNNEDVQRKIADLKNSKSSTQDFAIQISEVLESLGINIILTQVGENYILKHSSTKDVLKIEDISEGEQNLLALLYFYFELFEDKEQHVFKEDSIKLIVIDDPISSVDDINRMYVLEIVKKICKQKKPQIFVLTHVWDDFCDICYGKKDRDDTAFRFYEVKKNSDGSYLDVTRTNENPYKHNFKEIYEFSQREGSSQIEEIEIYHYPNIMRKILEEFLMFKTVAHNPTHNNIENIKKVLCGNKGISGKDEIEIGRLLSVCNVFSHRVDRNPDEILASAKYLMKKIKEVDKNHYDAMKE